LVRLGLVTFTLKVDLLLNTLSPEYVMATTDAFLEAEAMQQPAQIVERDIGV
jgi:hypothetical protein